MSSPRPLTERTSQYQPVAPLLPSERANPVMLLMVMGAFAARSEVSAGTLAAAQMRDKEWTACRARAPPQGLALGAQGSSLAASAGDASLVFLGGAVRATGAFGFFGGSAGGCAAAAGVSSPVSAAAAFALMSLSAARHF